MSVVTTAPAKHRVLATAALAASVLAWVIPPAAAHTQAATAANMVRLGTSENVTTAVALSRRTYTSATVAFVTRDDKFPDALASGGAQASQQGPLLLTDTVSLDRRTKEELDRLGVTKVFILGGPNSISDRVETQLRRSYQVERLAGSTRLQTAVAIADRFFPSADTAVLARGWGADDAQAFADAQAAGAMAADLGLPVLFSETERLSGETEAYLRRAGVRNVVIVGGPNAISEHVEGYLRDGMRLNVTRRRGPTRMETALAVDRHRGLTSAAKANGVLLLDAYHADSWAPGFTAAGLAGRDGYAVVLSDGVSIPTATRDYLADASDTKLLCAPQVTSTTCQQVRDIMDGQKVTGPTIVSATAGDNGDGRIGPGDRWTLKFSQAMSASTNIDVTYQTYDGRYEYIASFNCQIAAAHYTCAWADSTTLRVTVNTDMQVETYPATITRLTAKSTAGESVDLGASADRVID